jgi:hypothetical protein
MPPKQQLSEEERAIQQIAAKRQRADDNRLRQQILTDE